MFDKDLGFMFEPSKGARMDDPVPISLETRPKGTFLLVKQTATTVLRVGCETYCHDCPSCRLLLKRLYRDYPLMSCELFTNVDFAS
jgi:hypothetical protein